MSTGTAFHPRTAPLNHKLQWREWSGYFAASAYADHHEIEYNAIREAAALIDVSPLFKYHVTGSQATELVDRVITRDAYKIKEDGVIYTCWCNEEGRVLDDGTVARLDSAGYRWTAAEPSLRWFLENAGGLDVSIEDVTDRVAALALQGPRSRQVLEDATGESFADLRYFRRRATRIGDLQIDVSRTGYTGDLGYELWVDASNALEVWDRVSTAGEAHGLRPAGMLALDVARLEAGLILIDVDFSSARHALTWEQTYSPYEIGLGRMVNLGKRYFVGKRALELERDGGGPPRRLVGLDIDWAGIEALSAAQGLPPTVPAEAWRTPVPVYSATRQIGRATSGTWSPTLKKNIALSLLETAYSSPGTRVNMEWTIEARRGRVAATVVELPFFDPPRKRA